MRARNVDGVLRYYDDAGVEITAQQAFAELPAEIRNEADLVAKLREQVQINKQYLTIADTANASQVRSQVERLTRQNTAIMKILGRDLQDQDGT